MPYKTIDGITSSVIPFCVKDGIVFVLLGQRGKMSKAFANAWGLVGPRRRVPRPRRRIT
jgi:hypothetical protein